jgi:hypothetical protein
VSRAWLTRPPNGTRAVIRAIRADDKALPSDGLLRLSPESSRARFLALKIARPRQIYTGERDRDYVPVEQR